mgnify:CR=1 FL=1
MVKHAAFMRRKEKGKVEAPAAPSAPAPAPEGTVAAPTDKLQNYLKRAASWGAPAPKPTGSGGAAAPRLPKKSSWGAPVAKKSASWAAALGGTGKPKLSWSQLGGAAKDKANNAKLLAALKDVPEGARTARYWCVLVYLRHADDPVPLIVQCDWKGDILAYPRGNGGFGYDPLFWIPECGMSVAELSAEEKNRLSHRGRALQSLITQLKESGQVTE